MVDLGQGLAYYGVFLFSTTVHEAAHAWAAMRGGDLTACHGGQVTLDPIPHIRREPIGMVVLPLVSVFVSGWPLGFASAPYDPRWAQRHPRRAAWMALAGPAANLLLVLLAALIIRGGMALGWLVSPGTLSFSSITESTSPGWGDSIAFVIGALFALNLLLFVLNMLPIPPLDGSSAAILVLPGRAVSGYQSLVDGIGRFAFLGLLLAWRVFPVVFRPVFRLAVTLLYPESSYF